MKDDIKKTPLNIKHPRESKWSRYNSVDMYFYRFDMGERVYDMHHGWGTVVDKSAWDIEVIFDSNAFVKVKYNNTRGTEIGLSGPRTLFPISFFEEHIIPEFVRTRRIKVVDKKEDNDIFE